MKLGKNFGIWIQIILAILRSLIPFTVAKSKDPDEAGVTLTKRILGLFVKDNEDDALKGIDSDDHVY